MFAWKAVGVWFSLRVTCITGQTSRQNLWPGGEAAVGVVTPLLHESLFQIGQRLSLLSRAAPASYGVRIG